MQIQPRHTPSFAVARLALAPGEPARVESGAMVATSYGVTVEARASGGLLKSLARAALGGESFHVSTFTAPDGGGWVDVAPNLPGDLHIAELDGTDGWCITRGCWLASAVGVELATQWGGFHTLFGGEGGLLVHASGTGPVVAMGSAQWRPPPVLLPGQVIGMMTSSSVRSVRSVRVRGSSPCGQVPPVPTRRQNRLQLGQRRSLT